MYDLKNWNMAGWSVGTSYAYGWDAKPSTNPKFDQNTRLKESAWNFDILYTLQEGRAKGRSSSCTTPCMTTTPISQVMAMGSVTSSKMKRR